jgi:hypothetical protein
LQVHGAESDAWILLVRFEYYGNSDVISYVVNFDQPREHVIDGLKDSGACAAELAQNSHFATQISTNRPGDLHAREMHVYEVHTLEIRSRGTRP